MRVRKEYQIKKLRSPTRLQLWNLNYSADISRAWENINENIKSSATESLGLYELKQHKPCFDEGSLRFFDQRKQAKLQWLQHPNQS
jgi:hypothetical protein